MGDTAKNSRAKNVAQKGKKRTPIRARMKRDPILAAHDR
jgi:hypothetical protein